MEFVLAAQKDLFVEVDQEAHFVLRALPVLRGERIDGQPLHTGVDRRVDHLEQAVLTGLVPFGAGQPLRLRPTSVAIHHTRDVARNARRVERIEVHEGNLPWHHPSGAVPA